MVTNMIDDYLNDALKSIQDAKDYYMQFCAYDSVDVDYMGDRFNDALIVVERLKQEAMI